MLSGSSGPQVYAAAARLRCQAGGGPAFGLCLVTPWVVNGTSWPSCLLPPHASHALPCLQGDRGHSQRRAAGGAD